MENVVPNLLPQELLEEILMRLPCKSLIRFKCVCKSWHALLFHTKFISRHVSHHLIKNQNYPTHQVLFKICDKQEIHKLFFLSATCIPRETPIPKFKPDSNLLRICGHSNGILCLSRDYQEEVLLYNPVTTEFRRLPKFRHLPKTTEWFGAPIALGMGYDSFSHDFKVIRIQKGAYIADNNNVWVQVIFVEQYTLSSHSWTLLPSTNAELFDFHSDSFAIYFNRTFYWWAYDSVNYHSVIVAMNMDGDHNGVVFQMLPKPPSAEIWNPHVRSLTVWNDSISLIYCTPSNVKIWVMGEFGCWTLMTTIKHYLSREVPRPLVFWKGNELLMRTRRGKLKSYNVDTEETKDVLRPKKLRDVYNTFQFVNYVPSLVPLKGEIVKDKAVRNRNLCLTCLGGFK